MFYLMPIQLYGVKHLGKNRSEKEENCCRYFMGYYFQLAARHLLYEPSHRQNRAYHGLCYTSRELLAGKKKNSSVGPPRGIDPSRQERTLHITAFVTPVVNYWLERKNSSSVGPPRGIDPSRQERTLYP